MKLIQKVNAVPLPEIITAKKEAQRLFQSALEKHDAFNVSMKKARREAVEAGFYFLRARKAFEHGEWSEFVFLFKGRIAERTVRFYVELASQSIQWVLYKNPTLKDLDKIRELAVEMVMLSPRPLIELCRELGHMMKFGGYFLEDYEHKKKKASVGQLELNFAAMANSVEHLTHFGDPGYSFTYADGIERAAQLQQTIEAMETALPKLKAALQAEQKTVDV